MPIVKDLVLGVVLVVFGLFLIFFLIPEGIRIPRGSPGGALSPDFWPRIVAYLLTLLGLIVAAGALGGFALGGFRGRKAADSTDDGSDQGQEQPVRFGLLRVLVAMIALFVICLQLGSLGLLLGGILSSLVLGFLYAGNRLSILIVTSILFPAFLYFFFTVVAGRNIPLGVLTHMMTGAGF